ncbi:helix-turn-helix transcriptional regulator [Mumia zhuanghuii]|uniref:Helix-turn-helix domain-containing protein n=2 Tax=Mumia TaxID=1546255 RepID=A0ABW1QLL3_9ACTN|nr:MULTISPECIES: helix-turn-helix transcriptional regulator [Mumia]KAA1419862.1 helix-turn-helix transcriptional regulator [Mumia zhuanghuii]
MTTTTDDTASQDNALGRLLREWRTRRRFSQLALSSETGISTRHISFLETGRSRPSSEMIQRLADALSVPMREQNRMLLHGGYAPAYPERSLDHEDLAGARRAVREVLVAHEPNPALAVDRLWNVVDSNAGVDVLTTLVSPHLLEGPVNALRLTLHPDGLAPHLENHAEWRAAVLSALLRGAAARGDDEMFALHDELADYPVDDLHRPQTDTGPQVYVPMVLRVDGVVLSFLSVISTFGTPLDVTLSELAIETFVPADTVTGEWLRAHVVRR